MRVAVRFYMGWDFLLKKFLKYIVSKSSFSTTDLSKSSLSATSVEAYGLANCGTSLRQVGRRSELQKELDRTAQKKNTTTFVPNVDVRLDKTGHWPAVAAERGTRCKIPTCSSRPKTYCVKCKMYLCLNQQLFHGFSKRFELSCLPWCFISGAILHQFCSCAAMQIYTNAISNPRTLILK